MAQEQIQVKKRIIVAQKQIQVGDFILITNDLIEIPNEKKKRANPYYLKIGEVLEVNYQPHDEDNHVDNYVVCFGRSCEGKFTVIFDSTLIDKCKILAFK